ncbi:MAG: glycosyltransferase [Terriglobales bacterium]
MNITVILCTYNRCQSLANALASVASSVLPDSVDWEVLVVNNNSSDQTSEVVEEFRRRYPGRFRYLFEARQGKSHALNSGIREARGEVLAFMDDDVTVEPMWLVNLTTALRDGTWVGVGGRVLPERNFSPPHWLSLSGRYGMGAILAFFDLGEVAGELDRPPYGTNMAFRRNVFEKYGGFRLDLGPCPGSEMRNEDTEFGYRLLAAGERLWYEPSAVVHHPAPLTRLKKEYFLAWWFDYGRAAIRERGKRPEVWGIPRYYLTLAATGAIRVPAWTLRWILAWNPQRRFYWKCRVWRAAGEIAETYGQSRGPKSQEKIAIQQT